MPAVSRLAILCVGALGIAPQVIANPLAYENDGGGSVLAYGQLSPAWVGFDDGEETYSNLTDNAHSNTRVGIFIDQDFANGAALRFNFETALGLPSSAAFSQEFDPVWEWDKTKLRKIEVKYSDSWGALWIGQGEMATDGASSANLSEVTIASSRTVADTAGGYFFRTKDGELSDVKISQSHRKWDGSRRLRVRYDTPRFGGTDGDKGFYLSTSYGVEALDDENDNTYYDIAARFDDKLGDWGLKASIGYGWIEDDSDTSEYWSGAVSTIHLPTGLNGTIAGGSDPGTGGTFFYTKAGWLARDLVSVGATGFGVDYYEGRDTAYEGVESGKWGVHAVQYFSDLNLEAYLAYEVYTLEDDTGVSYQDASATMAGIRWKF
ncbi:porin [Tropicimonas sp. TH_r6]|uniref:porin n=1 Tax=Tropicimonas sp. TH_r6 TaxID=3082085 RepID=UPI002954DFDC|nr:porin [Tropicimonas sp. TH_r6]MDV7142604.1 porin [Tropicimonas sp. TH_r6]